MADTLATAQELATFLGLTYASLSAGEQARLQQRVELATSRIESAAGRRLVQLTSTIRIDVDMFDCGPWLDLSVSPVVSVATVLIDGVATTDYALRDGKLWRLGGWSLLRTAPSQVTVTLTHGYPAGSQSLILAKSMMLALAAAGWDTPDGAVSSEQIDDYRVAYAASAGIDRMTVTDAMRQMLIDEYGTPASITESR